MCVLSLTHSFIFRAFVTQGIPPLRGNGKDPTRTAEIESARRAADKARGLASQLWAKAIFSLCRNGVLGSDPCHHNGGSRPNSVISQASFCQGHEDEAKQLAEGAEAVLKEVRAANLPCVVPSARR